jgi:hypothetical protein
VIGDPEVLEVITEAVPSEPVEATDPKWVKRVFFPLSIIGLITAISLGVHAAHEHPDLSVGTARVIHDGLTATVQVPVHNRSKKDYCPTIEIAARDRDGLDIEKAVGKPIDSVGKVEPGRTLGFKFVFTDLTKKDYEKLDKFVGFVETKNPC